MTQTVLKWNLHDGLEVFGQAWEPQQAARAVVCLVHGIGEHSSRYEHVAAAFNQDGLVVLACDLRGHGKSQGQRGYWPSYEHLMKDIDLLLQQASQRYPGLPVFLYGHSMGGNLVLNYVLRRPDLKLSGVISTAPALRTAFDPPAWKMTLARLVYSLAPKLSMTNELDFNALSRDPAVVERYKQDPLIHNLITPRLAVDLLEAGEWALQNANRLPPGLPLLLMHGGEDRITSVIASQEFANKVGAACTYKLWDGFYHEIHNEPEQGQVMSYLLARINQHLS